MPKTVLLVVHHDASDPGRVARILRLQGFALDLRRPCSGTPLPEDPSAYAGVVIFGGPMSANDDHLEFIRRELAWIPKVLEAKMPLLGICLGAQMIARVLGGTVAPHPEGLYEIGYYPIHATEAGRDLFPAEMMVYHWHGEGFTLPAGAALLAEGDVFRHQAFRYGSNVYGVQFHPEVTPAIMYRWITRAAGHIGLPGAQSRREHLEQRSIYDRGLRLWLHQFLEHWLPPSAVAAHPSPA